MGGTPFANRIRLGIAGIIMVAWLAACVQPIEPTPTPMPPSPTVFLTPTPIPPPDNPPSFPPVAISSWLEQNLGASVNDLSILMQFQIGSDGLFDDILGYTFNDGAGQTCAGFAQAIAATATVLTSDYQCRPEGTPVIIGTIPFALLNGQFYLAIYGYIDPTITPAAGGVAAEFADGSNITQLLIGGSFVMLRPQLDAPIQLVVADTGGNTVTIVPIR